MTSPGGHDVIVVGAGTAGCIIAARYADAGARVLLLEAGADIPADHVPTTSAISTHGPTTTRPTPGQG